MLKIIKEQLKEITYKKTSQLDRGIKNFSVAQSKEDEQCITRIVKNFHYQIKPVDSINQTEEPIVDAKKTNDKKKAIERFNFHVKGCFFVTQNRFFYMVKYHHTLDIQLIWKNKVFSPKKSEALT